MRRFLFVATASLLVLGACKSLDSIPSSIPLGFVTVEMSDAPSVHRSSPTAYFVDAVNVNIPNSTVNADTCAQIGYPGSQVVSPLAQINGGTPVTFASTLDTAQLTPTAADVNGYIFYRLPTGDSVRIVPGSTNRVTIPGATNAFHAFDFTFVNADSLKIQPLQASADSIHDLPVTWNPQSGSSVVLQLEYGTSPGTVGTQIFCQFTDNGSHAVQASLANKWRTAAFKRVHAYRFRTTFNNDGSNEVVVVSTYETDSTTMLP